MFSLENEIFGVSLDKDFELNLLNIKEDNEYTKQMTEIKKNTDEKLRKTLIYSVLNMNLPELYLEERFRENSWID